MPGLLVAFPSTPSDAKGLMKAAIRLDDPVVFIEHKSLYLDAGEVPDGEHLVPFGQARVARPGVDVTIVAWGKMVPFALEAADTLAGEGVEAEVVDPRTLVPLDETAILESVARTGRLVVVHEAHRRGGFGGEVAAHRGRAGPFAHLRAPITRVAARDVPLPMAPNLERQILPQVDWIADAVRQSVGAAPTAGAAR